VRTLMPASEVAENMALAGDISTAARTRERAG
jgi:hypothetical protein